MRNKVYTLVYQQTQVLFYVQSRATASYTILQYLVAIKSYCYTILQYLVAIKSYC